MHQPDDTATGEGWWQRAWEGWSRFWFTPIDPIGFDAVRILFGAYLCIWLAAFAGRQSELAGLAGWFDAPAYLDYSRLSPDVRPQIAPGWSPLFVSHTAGWAAAFYAVSLAAAVLFTIGCCTRVTSVFAWLAVVGFTQNLATNYGGDAYLMIFAFYLMIGCVFRGQAEPGRSVVWRVLGDNCTWIFRRSAVRAGATPQPSMAANVALRLLQVHLAIVIFTSALHKLQTSVWWAGAALWFPFFPPFETSLDQVLRLRDSISPRLVMTFFSLSAYLAVAWQLSFPFAIWRPAVRKLMIAGGAVGCLGHWFFYDLPIFGPAILLSSLVFLTPAEWRRAYELLRRRFHSPKENGGDQRRSERRQPPAKSVA
jgi:hypothetical protein